MILYSILAYSVIFIIQDNVIKNRPFANLIIGIVNF